MDSQRRIRLASLVWTLGIVTVSLAPSGGGVSLGDLDKVGHYLAYMGLAVLICLGFDGAKVRVGALLGAVVLGVLLEWGQSFVPGRYMSLADGVVNALGVLSGAVLFRFRGRELRRWTEALVGRRVG